MNLPDIPISHNGFDFQYMNIKYTGIPDTIKASPMPTSQG